MDQIINFHFIIKHLANKFEESEFKCFREYTENYT